MGYKCIICEQYFNLKCELYRHLGSHDIKKIKQDICKSAAQKHNFTPYLQKNTESNSLIESNYQNLLHYVSNCSFVSRNKILKNINSRKSGDVIESKICDICNERLPSQQELQIHIKNHKDFEEKQVVEHYLHLSDSENSTTDVKEEEKCEDIFSNSPQNITIKKEKIMEGYGEFNNVEVSALRKGPITGYYEDFSKSLGGTMIKDEQTVKYYDGYSTSTIKEEEMIKCHKSFNLSQETITVKVENDNHCNEPLEFIAIKEEKIMEFDEDLSNSQDFTIKSEPVTDYHVYSDSNSKNVLNVNDEHTTESHKSFSQFKDFTALDVQEQIKIEYPVENCCDLRNSVKANVGEDENRKLYKMLPFRTDYNRIMEKQPDEPQDFLNEPLFSMSEPMDVQDAVASTLTTPFAQPIIAASKSKAQKQREYRQRIAASRTPAQAAAARKSKNERQRNNRLRARSQRQHGQQQCTTTADQPDEHVNLTNEPFFLAIPVPMEVQEAVASTSVASTLATLFAQPIIAASKSKAQKKREYRQRIAASRTPAQAAAVRKSINERQRNNRLRARSQQQHAQQQSTTTADQPDEHVNLTNEPLFLGIPVPMKVQEAFASTSVASTLTTPFAQPIIAALKSKAQKKREYRQRIAASRTPAQAAAVRKSINERQRNNRLRARKRQQAQQQSTTTADQPDERVSLTNEPLFSAIPVPMEVQEAVASTSVASTLATPFAQPIIAASKSKAQKQREYRQRIAASRTPAQAAAARKSKNERQRNNRLRQARSQRQHAQQQSTTTADQPDERVNLTNEFGNFCSHGGSRSCCIYLCDAICRTNNCCSKNKDTNTTSVSQNATNEEENFTESFSHNSYNNVENMCDLKDTLHEDSSKPFFQHSNDLEHLTTMETYQCDVCKLQFHVKCDLCKHLQSMHEKMSYQCNFCKEGFKVKREFYKHLSSHYFKNLKGLMKPSVKRK